VKVGVQNLHWAEDGPWTGEISAAMAADCGATLAEIGHSERRAHFGETDGTVALKVAAALRHGLTPLVCVGDTREEYEAGRTAETLDRQTRAAVSGIAPQAAARVVIAYEPVWAIGEHGIPAEPAFADEQHARIKASIGELTGCGVRVIYGGSVNLRRAGGSDAYRRPFHWPIRVGGGRLPCNSANGPVRAVSPVVRTRKRCDCPLIVTHGRREESAIKRS
jgi:triosephosphate isomerase